MQLFFEPRSVVLIGTSRQTGPGAYNNLEMLLSYGYPGRIFLVHPKVPDIMGYKTHPRVADLPEVPDLAVISLGRERVVDTAVECAQHGIKRLVVISQGFADADARGAELQAELVRLAREHGVRVLGPNTMGVLNPFSGFTTAFIDVPRDPRPSAPHHGGPVRGLPGGGLVLHRAAGQGHRRGQCLRPGRGGCPGISGGRSRHPHHCLAPGRHQAGPAVSHHRGPGGPDASPSSP